LEQFLTESDRIIPEVASAIRAGKLDEMGRLVDLSQKNSEKLLLNQVPETVALCKLARELGAVGASAFGAGFGGAVWALVPEGSAGEFVKQWRENYVAAFPGRKDGANFIVTRPGPAARRV
jgi:galactokinase